jgi:hypothetical protein
VPEADDAPVRLTLVPMLARPGDAPPAARLRLLLKYARRRLRLRCVKVEPVPPVAPVVVPGARP